MNPKEFESQLIQMEEPLRSFSYRFTNNAEDSRELVQETMLKALVNQEKFRENVNFKAWLFRIMRNIFINQYKRSKKVRYDLDTTDEASPSARIPDLTHHTPDEFCQLKEITSEVRKLKMELRDPLVMYLSGFKYREIAEKLDLPIGTVKNKIFLARQELATTLSAYRQLD